MSDTEVLEAAMAVLTKALDDLCMACLDDRGQPQAPDRKALMKARAMLPRGHMASLIENKKGTT